MGITLLTTEMEVQYRDDVPTKRKVLLPMYMKNYNTNGKLGNS